MKIPPYDSVDYAAWCSNFSATDLSYFIDDFDPYQVDQLRWMLAEGSWFGGDLNTLARHEVLEEIAAAVRSYQWIFAADPTQNTHIRQNVSNWLVSPEDSFKLDWIRGDKLLYCAHSFHYLHDNETVPSGYFEIEPFDEQDPSAWWWR